MTEAPVCRVFLSYTATDLEAHADVAADAVRKVEWIAVDHKDWAPTGRPSVQECVEQVSRCQVLVVLVAYRYGWVPSVAEGGDGQRSITRIEVEAARDGGLTVLPFLVDEESAWPPKWMEGLSDPEARERLGRFRKELEESHSGFFAVEPASLELQLFMALQKIKEQLRERSPEPPAPEPGPSSGTAVEERRLVPLFHDPVHPPTLKERLETNLPKRILSIDGYGVRTSVAIGLLKALERDLRARYGSEDFRLGDYFDLIGGVGAGTWIAADLARGRPMEQVESTWRRGFERGWKKENPFLRWRNLYKSRPVEELVRDLWGDCLLEDRSLTSGLCLISTRLATRQTCTFTNHPADESGRGMRLRDLLMAAGTGPPWIRARRLRLPSGETGLFGDGATSVGSDPALFMFLVATDRDYPFRWRRGERRLCLVSVGAAPWSEPPGTAEEKEPGLLRSTVMFIDAAHRGLAQQTRRLLGSLAGSFGAGREPHEQGVLTPLTYHRIEAPLDRSSLIELGRPDLADRAESFLALDATETVDDLIAIGDAAATRVPADEILLATFDVRRPVPRAS